MPVSFLSPAQRDSYGQYLGDPSTQELARYFHLDDSDHTQIVEKRGDANRLGFALQLTTVRFVGTFLDDPTAVPPAVLATMSRQLGIDTTTDLTGYRDGKWRFAHAAQIRTEHVSAVARKSVILDGTSTTTCRGCMSEHRRQEPIWTSVRGAGVKAVSPAERGRSEATRLDVGEHTRTLLA